jgi:hypothetical protein
VVSSHLSAIGEIDVRGFRAKEGDGIPRSVIGRAEASKRLNVLITRIVEHV